MLDALSVKGEWAHKTKLRVFVRGSSENGAQALSLSLHLVAVWGVEEVSQKVHIVSV